MIQKIKQIAISCKNQKAIRNAYQMLEHADVIEHGRHNMKIELKMSYVRKREGG